MARSALGIQAAITLVLLTSCATQTNGPGGSHGSRPSRAGIECKQTGSGFALDLAIDSGGQATPLAEVVHFGKQGGERDYRAAADKWAQSPSEGERPSKDGMTLRTNQVFLHVIQLRDHSWAVDSGGHCAN